MRRWNIHHGAGVLRGNEQECLDLRQCQPELDHLSSESNFFRRSNIKMKS